MADLERLVSSPLVASTAAAMTNTNRVYVYTGNETGMTNGNWYYYSGNAWVSGGVYNAVAVETDDTLTVEGMPADAKVTGDDITDLKSAIGADIFSMNFGSTSIYSNYDKQISLTDNTNCTVYLLSLNSLNFNKCEIYALVNSSWTKLAQINSVGDSANFTIPASATTLRVGPILTAADNTSPKWTGCIFIDSEGGQNNYLMRQINNVKNDLFDSLSYVTPQMYGAVGDGVTDDTSALQDAIDSGKKVIIPHGSYMVSEPLVISKQGVTIEGENNRSWGTYKQCSEIILKPGVYMSAFFSLTGNANNFSLKNIVMFGDTTTWQPANGILYNSTDSAFASDILIENVNINYCTVGINIDSIFKSIFTNVRIANCRTYGFKLSGKTSGDYAADGTTVTMINCYVNSSVRSYALQRLRYSSLINCASDDATVSDYELTTCSGVSFINCGCENSGGVPLYFVGSNSSIQINGMEIIALGELTSGLDDALISCYGLLNTIISGVAVVGETNRSFDIYNKSPDYTSIVILDDSINPSKCSDISNGKIRFLNKQIIYSTNNSPDFVGQLALTSSGLYYSDANLSWIKIQSAV